jgi:hypothetical protein
VIAVASITPCPVRAASGATEAVFSLLPPPPVPVSRTAALDPSGDWAGTIRIPASAADGTSDLIAAHCLGLSLILPG